MRRPALLAVVAALAFVTAACNRDDRAELRENARAGALQLDDSWLTTKVEARFFADPDVKARRIDVDTSNGVVTLTGTVASERIRDRAISLARETEGVRDVRNELTVRAGTEEPTGTTGTARVAEGGAADLSQQQFTRNRMITSRIQARYFGDGQVKGRTIDVTTRNGVVTLAGTVATDSERQRAVEIARQTEGVTGVQDRLRVDPVAAATTTPDASAARETAPNDAEIVARVQSRFYADDDLRTTDIGVASAGGVVTLSGTVGTEARKRHAMAVARSISHVSEVRDDLRVEPTVPPLPPQAPAESPPDDGMIVTRIQARYYQEPALKTQAITVASERGIVTLSGEIGGEDKRQQAVAIAKDTRGVARVVDRLTLADEEAGASDRQ